MSINHPIKFIQEFFKDVEKIEFWDNNKYTAELQLKDGRIRVNLRLSDNEVIISSDEYLFKEVLFELLKLSEYLRKSLMLCIIDKPMKIDHSDGYMKLPGGEVRFVKVTDSLWIGSDGNVTIISGDIRGIAELVEVIK